jgi:hypothetical protein
VTVELQTVAQATEAVGGSSTLLGALLSGALLVTITGVYRFAVNFRNTERGMQRKRIRDANMNERAAQNESALWQGRCGDLEYILRSRGIPVPPLPKELAALVIAEASANVEYPEDQDETTDGRPAP